jgi:hypothetical protein
MAPCATKVLNTFQKQNSNIISSVLRATDQNICQYKKEE